MSDGVYLTDVLMQIPAIKPSPRPYVDWIDLPKSPHDAGDFQQKVSNY